VTKPLLDAVSQSSVSGRPRASRSLRDSARGWSPGGGVAGPGGGGFDYTRNRQLSIEEVRYGESE